MAEENKSWFPNIGILSDSSLLGIPAEMQDQLQREATKRMFIGGLLSGRPDIGFQSAIGTATDYATSQQRLMELAEKQRQQQEEAAWSAKYNPTKYQETSPEFAGPVTPDVSAYQTSIGQARAMGLPTADVNAALRDLTVLRSPRQAAMLEGFKASLPKVNEQTGLAYGPGLNIVGGLPTIKDNIQTNPVIQNGQVRFQAQPVIGAAQAVQTVEAAKALGQAAGQVEKVYNKQTGQMEVVPRSSVISGFGTGGVGGTGGGFAAEQPSEKTTLQSAARKRFETMSEQSTAAAQTAGTRRQASESIYNLAESLDPNKATEWVAQASPYLRSIPGLSDKLAQFSTDATLLNQEYSKNLLTQFASGAAKGNLNPQEVTIFQKSVGAFSDPKHATKWNAALGIAGADKDEAKMTFLENYTGDPAKFNKAWIDSPDNIKIYNHPKVNQFLTEQVQSWAAKPNKSTNEAPVLPPGFEFGMSKDGSSYKIKKPDGSLMTIGAK